MKRLLIQARLDFSPYIAIFKIIIVYFFLYSFCYFLYPISSLLDPPQHFSTPPPLPPFSSTYPILPRSERVLYSAVTYTLSGCMNVQPIPLSTRPANPQPGPPWPATPSPTWPHPARRARHPTPHPASPCPPLHPTVAPGPNRPAISPPGPTLPQSGGRGLVSTHS